MKMEAVVEGSKSFLKSREEVKGFNELRKKVRVGGEDPGITLTQIAHRGKIPQSNCLRAPFTFYLT